jgi:hypothetical protein
MSYRRFTFKKRERGEKTEYEDAWETALRKRADVVNIMFERIKLRLADNTFYTPDYCVFMADGTIEFHEVKGSWKAPGQDDSKVKIKVAAETYKWAVFRSVELKKVAKKNGGGWQVTEKVF